MGKWLRKLRGLVGVGLFGTIAGGLFGGLFAFASSVLGFLNLFGTFQSSVTVLALFGGASSIVMGVSIPMLARSERVSELSPLVPGFIGLLVGAAAPLVLVAGIRGTVAIPGIGLVAAITGVFGGALTAGMVAIAGQAERRELEAGSSTSEKLIESGDLPRSAAR